MDTRLYPYYTSGGGIISFKDFKTALGVHYYYAGLGWSEEGGTGLNFIDVCLLEICIHFAQPPLFSRLFQSGSM